MGSRSWARTRRSGRSARVLQREQTGLVGKGAVVSTGRGRATLIEELKVARIDGHGLVVGHTDKITRADIVGPGGATVRFPSERVTL